MNMESTWQGAVETIRRALIAAEITLQGSRPVTADEGFRQWQAMTADLRRRHGTIYLIGNGASASMASHLSADLAKNGKVHTQVFSDLSLITAIANDISYEQVFAEPLRTSGTGHDMLVAISSSGASPNILAAVNVARELQMIVVTLSGMKADNPLRGLGDLNVYVGADTYGLVESCHSAILHRWMDMVTL